MKRGSHLEDFIITVGDSTCVPASLKDSQVDCRPPSDTPNRHVNDTSCQDDTLSINVCMRDRTLSRTLILTYRGVYPPNTLEQVPSSPSPSVPFPLPSPPLAFLPLPVEVSPLIAARGSWGALQLPQRVRAEPGRQTVFGEFQAKNLASSSNDLQELFIN